MEKELKQYLETGQIVNTHGVRGEIKLLPTTDDVNRFHRDLPLVLDTGKEPVPVTVSTVTFGFAAT